ncbi:hypothetical protein INT47_005056 [Mucor saturninus]|uniref:Cullin family profile domain-containing protein n=1 Tax=Mucor saturninus TaxID=64648 RepID=A0A8H7QMK7_9FUNG|nr:hypothetical protein INT47_005056 [Mucor saturninus]
MLSMYQFPKQTRALDAIKRLKIFLEIQGNTEKEPLPTMSKIVDYCIKYPRLLRIRDSPLKVLHDPSLPYVVVHDWYIGIALDYLEASVVVLLEQWEKDFKKKRHAPELISEQFVRLVDDIYKCYEHTGLALKMPFPEGSPLGAAELKDKVKYASIALIKDKTTHFFTDTTKSFYEEGLKTIEILFRARLKTEENPSFAYLFSPGVAKYKDQELEFHVQSILDSNLPGLVDVFNLPDDMLEDACNEISKKKKPKNISIDSWMDPTEDEDYESVEKHESKLQDFSDVCVKLNALSLTPDWTAILVEIIKKRLHSQKWIDKWDESMVTIQLKWLHVLILPWISYVLPKVEDINANWNDFLRQKMKAEHILYENIYQTRIPHIFDIIEDYPSTSEAILDFHITATKRGLLEDLKEKLIQELQVRLLHQGAAAARLLNHYSNCTQCLCIIDPSCKTMVPIIHLVEDYVKQYRNDIIDGAVELVRGQGDDAFQNTENGYVYVFKQSEINDEEAPRTGIVIEEDETAMLRKLQEKSRDPVAMIISMCNPIQKFIERYGDILAEALLQLTDYDTDKEVQRLELLKKNFPADAFTKCDVMLRDVDSSKRLDRQIHENPEIDSTFHTVLLSRLYWPDADDEDNDDSEDDLNVSGLQLWPRYESTLEKYEEEYKSVRASRKLKYLHNKGSVVLQLEFKDRVETFKTSPEAATIISLFETKDNQFTKNEIAEKVGLSKQKVIEALEFWAEKNVIELLANGNFVLLED